MATHMLTTIDNPYNPFTHYDEWWKWDHDAGYHTPSYLARVLVTSDEMSEADQDLAIELAIDEILKENITGNYRKVVEPAETNSNNEAVEPIS